MHRLADRGEYGMFFVENGMVSKGTMQLNLALDKYYKKWGAMKKANELQQFIDCSCEESLT